MHTQLWEFVIKVSTLDLKLHSHCCTCYICGNPFHNWLRGTEISTPFSPNNSKCYYVLEELSPKKENRLGAHNGGICKWIPWVTVSKPILRRCILYIQIQTRLILQGGNEDQWSQHENNHDTQALDSKQFSFLAKEKDFRRRILC